VFRAGADDDAPVISSRKRGGHLDPSQVLRIVQQAATARIRRKVSPHWFRHAHASHAMDRGSREIHLVCATLAHSSIAITGRYLHAKPTQSSAKFLAVLKS
jgi:integrase/recombinase XerD